MTTPPYQNDECTVKDEPMTDSDPNNPPCPKCGESVRVYHGVFTCPKCEWNEQKRSKSTDSDLSDKPMSEYPEAPCGECGRPTNRVYVPVEALQELHTDMLNTAQSAGSQGAYQTANVVESFAEDVEALIDDYSNE